MLANSLLPYPNKAEILEFKLNRWGWFGMALRPITASRMVAIGLLVVAIALTQLDRDSRQASRAIVSKID